MIQRKPWKLLLALVAVLAVGLFVPLTAQAGLVTDGEFDTTTTFTDDAFNFEPPDTTTNASIWLAGESWVPNTTDKFAEKTETSTETALLVQGFLLPDTCIASGWKVKYSFKYKSPGEAGSFKIYGFNSAGSVAPDGTITGSPTEYTATLNEAEDWETVQGSFSLTGGHEALAVAFDLQSAVTDTTLEAAAALDDISVDVVAPIAVKFTPRTFNVKSNGVVSVTLSNPPSCLSLDQIVDGSVELVYVDGEDISHSISPIRVQKTGKKFMLKFSRQELAAMLGVTTGSQVPLYVTGTFATDAGDIMFEGQTTVRVINPAISKPSKPTKPGKAFNRSR